MSWNLVGLAEIAELLGISRQRADQLARSSGFPAAIADLAAGRIWDRDSIETWAAATSREVMRVHTRFRGLMLIPAAHCESCGTLLVSEKDAAGRIWSSCPNDPDLRHPCMPPSTRQHLISDPCEVCGKVWEWQPQLGCWKVVAPSWWPSTIESRVALRALAPTGPDVIARAVHLGDGPSLFVVETTGHSLAIWQVEAEPALRRLAFSVLSGDAYRLANATFRVLCSDFPNFEDAVRHLYTPSTSALPVAGI